jgi:hypothetical protein
MRFDFTSKLPLLRTNGMEQMEMTMTMRSRTHPKMLDVPGKTPKVPVLEVNIHSTAVNVRLPKMGPPLAVTVTVWLRRTHRSPTTNTVN